ncbi:MAG: SDR family NAD(P)-dependent oxidoreductase [Candidatus Hydrogenedentes bacterium]|nr:SDR family NAD(P)-dependent oxidoreductase [Candidatus Hydrogenedentota bacterium]
MGQNFFLTGCGSGMAQRLTTTLLARGDSVFATDVNLEALNRAAEDRGWPKDRVRLAKLDVTSSAAWETVFAEAVAAFGHIDVTMNIAGLLMASWADASPLREIDAQIDVNLKGVIYGSRISAQHMVPRGKGHIVNIASIAGIVPAPGLSTYCATKYAVRAYSIAAAFELRPKGVYVTAVCPASIQTPMLDNQLHNDAAEMFYSGFRILTLDEIEDAILNRVLVKRPYEIHIPRWKSKLARIVDRHPFIGPLMAPIYQRSGRKRQEARRKAGAS